MFFRSPSVRQAQVGRLRNSTPPAGRSVEYLTSLNIVAFAKKIPAVQFTWIARQKRSRVSQCCMKHSVIRPRRQPSRRSFLRSRSMTRLDPHILLRLEAKLDRLLDKSSKLSQIVVALHSEASISRMENRAPQTTLSDAP